MSEKAIEPTEYVVTWGLEVIPVCVDPYPIFDAPDVNFFRIKFPNQRAAAQFIAEIQRFTGATLIELLNNGIKLRVK